MAQVSYLFRSCTQEGLKEVPLSLQNVDVFISFEKTSQKKLYVLQDLCLLNKWETPLFFQCCCYGVTPIFSRGHYHNEAYEAS